MPIPKAFASYFPLPPTRFLCHQLSLCLLLDSFATTSHFASYVHLYRPLTKRCYLV